MLELAFPVTYGAKGSASVYARRPARANGEPLSRPSLSDDWDSPRANGVPHNAFDIIAGEGSPVVAMLDGIVAREVTIYRRGEAPRKVPGVGYGAHGGWYVYLDHAGGRSSYYAHLRTAPRVELGQRVPRGRVIGNVGRTGPDSGPFHLHTRFLDTRTRRPIYTYRELREAYDAGGWRAPIKFLGVTVI